jgi:hypothetical protein
MYKRWIKRKTTVCTIIFYNPIPFKGNWDIIKENDCTYGGLSFNPSLIHVSTLKKCLDGVYQDMSDNREWDKMVSQKFWNMGYRRANLMNNYIWHIGNKISFYKRNI